MKEASGRGFYPGPGEYQNAQQDRLRKCSLATVESESHWQHRSIKRQPENSNGLQATGKSVMYPGLTGSSLRNC